MYTLNMNLQPAPDRSIRAPAGRLRLCAALLLAGVALAAHAEKADRTKPILLEANSVTIDQAKHVSTYLGNVQLNQGTLAIHADRVVIHQNPDGTQYATAYGTPVTFRQKRDNSNEWIQGHAREVDYDSKTEQLNMHTQAFLKSGLDQVEGAAIAYNVGTGYFQVLGGGSKNGRSAGNGGGRVHAVIYPRTATQGNAARGGNATRGGSADDGGNR